jgi:bacillithiol biosynthesis deacetylase BshB1
MKLDILAIAAHPDDVELGCSGTLMAHVDLTRGELGTRGTPKTRFEEAQHAASILGVEVRENAGFADGFFRNDEEHQKALIYYIRKYQPEIVLANAITDRHPDHGRGAALIHDACFYSGLRMVETKDENGNMQEAWRPKQVYHFVQDQYIKPDFIFDITPYFEKKMEAILAFKTQFFVPEYNSNEPQSYISSPEFIQFIRSRAEEYGHAIGAKYGEGFTSYRKLGVTNLFDLK